MLTPLTIDTSFPCLNDLQRTDIKRLLLQVRLDEYDKLRESGWVKIGSDQDKYIRIRETIIITKMAAL